MSCVVGVECYTLGVALINPLHAAKHHFSETLEVAEKDLPEIRDDYTSDQESRTIESMACRNVY